MGDDSVVRTKVLRDAINGILDFIEKDLGMTEVELGKDHYWEFLDKYSLESPLPAQLAAGSLIDDWEFVASAAKHKEQLLPLTLMHVAPLLHALAQAVPSYRDSSEAPD